MYLPQNNKLERKPSQTQQHSAYSSEQTCLTQHVLLYKAAAAAAGCPVAKQVAGPIAPAEQWATGPGSKGEGSVLLDL